MRKTMLSVRVQPRTIELLKQIAGRNSRSQGGEIDDLVKRRATSMRLLPKADDLPQVARTDG